MASTPLGLMDHETSKGKSGFYRGWFGDVVVFFIFINLSFVPPPVT